MSARKRGGRGRGRKRKGACDIFEVNEKDLSPEPEGRNVEEPQAKITKRGRSSDISESRDSSIDSSIKATPTSADLEEESGAKGNEEKNDDCLPDSKPTSDSQKSVIIIENDNSRTEICREIINLDEEELTSQNGNESLIIIDEDSGSKNSSCEIVDLEVHSTDIESVSIVEPQSEVIIGSNKSSSEVVASTVTDSVEAQNNEKDKSMPIEVLEDGEVNDTVGEETNTPKEIDKPALTIKFRDKLTAGIYKRKLITFIQAFVELNPVDEGTTLKVFRDDSLNPKEWDVLDHAENLKEDVAVLEEVLAKQLPHTPKHDSPKKRKKRKKAQSAPDLFVVDTKPALVTNKPLTTMYSAKFSIDDEKPDEPQNAKSRPGPGALCFNCDQAHSLKDCPLPRNHAKINANRQKFQNKTKSSRYHLEEEQKFAHMKPGQISSDLRKALGLKKHQIPSYVYKMRAQGYPPGWLEEAKYVSSDLSMFDIDGKNVRNINPKKKEGLNPEKVVDYPGFNVPLEKGCKDEYKNYHVPPFSDNFSKQNMVDFFNKITEKEHDDLEAQDMDIDNGDALGDAVQIEIEAKQAESSISCESNNDPAISLQELEKQKFTLLEEIKKAAEIQSWDQPSDDTNPSTIDEASAESTKEVNEPNVPVDKEEEGTTSNQDKDDSKTAVTTTTEIACEADETLTGTCDSLNEGTSLSLSNSVKQSVFGTPILKSCSPYAKLPCPDNFMKGVSPVIDFENLPNSTGKYEQMTGVLQKVRNTLKDLQK